MALSERSGVTRYDVIMLTYILQIAQLHLTSSPDHLAPLCAHTLDSDHSCAAACAVKKVNYSSEIIVA